MTQVTTFHLDRFEKAQRGTIDAALAELAAGAKRSHWMWFVFPQLRGLGRSHMAELYGIASLDEAKAYLAHPVLGPRLEACTRAVLASPTQDPHLLFGSPDDLKFRSSMTLFAQASGEAHSIYAQALERFCGGKSCAETMRMLGSPRGP